MKQMLMKKLFIVVMIVMVTSLVAACGGNTASQETTGTESPAPAPNATNEANGSTAEAEEIIVKHQLGETPVQKNPQRVVVFDFGILDTLDKLGIPVIGVPQTSVPPYLAKYEDSQYANVGSLKEPDFEKIYELQPDLIIISGRQQEMYAELSEIGPTIFLGVDTTRYMDSFIENTKIIGQIFDQKEAVEAELAQINQAIEQLHSQVAENGKKSLIILANDGKISAYGAGSRFGIIHDVFGFAPVDENIEVSTHGQSISFEYIAEMNPDYLFVVDRGAVVAGGESSAKEIVENELVMNTKAYQEGQIIYLDPNYWYLSGGGLISVAEMVKEVADALK